MARGADRYWANAVAALLVAAWCAPAFSQSPAGSTQQANAHKGTTAKGAVEREAPPGKQLKPVTDIYETVARVPVKVKLADGTPHDGTMLITHYRPAGTGPFPVVVFTHGRNSLARHDPPRWRAVPTARFWTRRGFAVLVMTRVGYGELGQDVDPEAGGTCTNVDYAPALDAMTIQIERAIAFAATLPWADTKRVVLQGVSYGGFGTIAATAKGLPGVVGAINFVGGMGGNPLRRPRDPCQGEKIVAIAAAAGARSKVPMLWLYAENDAYWGSDWPKRWHGAFTAAGGKAQMASFGTVGSDGHKLLNEGFNLWRPVVDSYVASLGFKLPVAAPGLKASDFARLDDAARVPFVNPAGRNDGYTRFLAADVPRAFAVSPTGAWAWRSGPDAVKVAIERCQAQSAKPCALYAVDDRVVWRSGQR